MTKKCKLACVFAVTAGMLVIAGSALAQQATPLFAVLNGGNECINSSPPDCRQGDPNGFGSATVIFPTATSVCFGVVVSGLGTRIIAAHIHRGASGISGPIVIFFIPPTTPPASENPGAFSNCVTASGVPTPIAATILAIRADPSKFYVNVHTRAFPAGAIRGQLQ